MTTNPTGPLVTHLIRRSSSGRTTGGRTACGKSKTLLNTTTAHTEVTCWQCRQTRYFRTVVAEELGPTYAPAAEGWQDLVGTILKGHNGGYYIISSHDHTGLWIEPLSESAGERRSISERAIGRTFWEIDADGYCALMPSASVQKHFLITLCQCAESEQFKLHRKYKALFA